MITSSRHILHVFKVGDQTEVKIFGTVHVFPEGLWSKHTNIYWNETKHEHNWKWCHFYYCLNMIGNDLVKRHHYGMIILIFPKKE